MSRPQQPTDELTETYAGEDCETSNPGNDSFPGDQPSDDSKRFGNYKLIERLGRGATGDVFRAVHLRLRKQVALKLLHAAGRDDERAAMRFNREARLLCELDHPNIVRIETAGHQESTPYLVMEYLDGIDLAQLVTRLGPLRPADACQLIGQAALGLDHLHQHGLVHRDIKPSNLVVCSGSILKVIDLGMACHLDSDEELTPSGRVVGNLQYIAPEYLLGTSQDKAPDIRGDIYSLGCTLFTLLVGRPPFQDAGTNLSDVLTSKTKRPLPLEQLVGGVPARLRDVIIQMTESDPNRRIATPMQVVAKLAPFAEGCNLPMLMKQLDDGTPEKYFQRSRVTDTAEYLRRNAEDSGELSRARTKLRSWNWAGGVAAGFLAVILTILTAGSFSHFTKPPQKPAATAMPAKKGIAAKTSPEIPSRPARHFLSSIVPERDSFELDVTSTQTGCRISNREGRGIVQLPVIMPPSFTMDFSITRRSPEGSVGIGFSVGNNRLLALLDHPVAGQPHSGMYFGKSNRELGFASPLAESLLPIDTPVRFRLSVTPARARLLRINSKDVRFHEVTPSVTQIDTWRESTIFQTPDPDGVESKPSVGLGDWDGYYPDALFIQVVSGSFEIDNVDLSDAAINAQPFAGAEATDERLLAEQILWRGGHLDVTTDQGPKTVKSLDSLTDDPWLTGSVAKCPSAPSLALEPSQLSALSRIRDLQKLDLISSSIDDNEIGLLSGMQGLSSLSIGNGKVTGAALASLSDLPKLRHLGIAGMVLTEEQLSELSRFPDLTSFCLSSCTVSDAGVAIAAEHLPQLQHICLSGAAITSRSLQALESLNGLVDLTLFGTNVGDDDIEVLLRLSSLKTLTLRGTRLTESGLESLRKLRPGLQVTE